MEGTDCLDLEGALDALDRVAPGTPLLALGQTIFWDETVKAGLALLAHGRGRRFVAGVHDTDYFAKLPSGRRGGPRFAVIPHNDTTTKGLWSAAGEFSTLFGSETVVTRDILTRAGLRVDRLQEERPGILDEATEAFGWRGVVSRDDATPVTAELPFDDVFPALHEAFDWALDGALAAVAGPSRPVALAKADALRAVFCDPERHGGSLSDFYQRLLPEMLRFVAGEAVPTEITATTRLLAFRRDTAGLPRFALLDLFLRPDTAETACAAYDEALREGSGQYALAQFGTGAIPFDLVVPGRGRGTIRIGRRGIVINTPRPLFLSLKKPLSGVAELAGMIEDAWGPDCAVVGKAVALIGMLAREHVFVFHEGASSYVTASRRLHEILARAGHPQPVHPILRVRYDAWTALRTTDGWLKLPAPLGRPFGAEEIRATSFAGRWRDVGAGQDALLKELGASRSPLELIRFLDRRLQGGWLTLATEYEELHRRLGGLQAALCDLRQERRRLYEEHRVLKEEREVAERASGAHWRAAIFEKEPTEEDVAERARLRAAVDEALARTVEWRGRVAEHRRRWQAKVTEPEILSAHARRGEVEFEAELARLRLVREAVTAGKGLRAAALRPSGWWFPLVSPNGAWFRETVRTAEAYLEPLT